MKRVYRSAVLTAAVSIGLSTLMVPPVLAEETAAVAVCPAKEGDTAPTASVVADERNEDTNSIHVMGRGWCAQPGHGGSTVVVKIDRGAYNREDQNSLPREFRNRGVWKIIKTDDKTGNFDVTIDLPNDISDGDHGLFFLSGSFKKDDEGNLVDVSRSKDSHFVVGEHVPDPLVDPSPVYAGGLKPPPADKKDNIIAVPDANSQELKIVYPAGHPGEWVRIRQLYFVMSDTDKDGHPYDTLPPSSPTAVCGQFESWPFYAKDFTKRDWYKLDEQRAVTLPYNYLRRTVGPTIIIARTEAFSPEVEDQTVLGWTWINNHGTPDKQDIYPGFVDPITPERNTYNVFKEWVKTADASDSQKELYLNWLGCEAPRVADPEESNLDETGRAVAYPVKPVVDGQRNLVIPSSPAVDYFIDGKKVSGLVAPAGDDASVVTVVAKPALGFRFVLPKKDGRIDPSKNLETSYEVEVPAASAEKNLIEAPQSGPRSDTGEGSLTVTPGRVKAGEVITVAGSGYADLTNGGHIAVKIDDGGKIKPNPNQDGMDVIAPEAVSDHTAVKTDLLPGADGSWSVKVRIPKNLAPGRHWVRVLSNNGAGSANASHHAEFKVTDANGKVPGETDQPTEPVVVDPPTVNVLRGMLQDQNVSVKDPAKLSDAELTAVQNAVAHSLGQGYKVSVADGKVVASREGGDSVSYALDALFPAKPVPSPKPESGNDSSSHKDSTGIVSSGLIGSLVGAFLAVLGIGGFVASNPSVLNGLPQLIRQVLGR